jgi:hypothetical protein
MRRQNITSIPWFQELIAPHQPPCVSIYMPTLRAEPPAAENGRLFRDLVEKARDSLSRGYGERDVGPLVDRIMAVPDEPGFWTAPRDGLAVFASPDLLRVIDLKTRVDSRVDVADSFHVKPLIRMMQSDRRYHVLALTLKHADLYEATQYDIRRLPAPNVPQDPDTVSKMRMSNQITATDDIRTASTQHPQEGTSTGGVSEERFMRAVDQAIWEQFSRDSHLPLILVADEKRHTAFRAVSKNIHLMEKGLTLDPNGIDPARIHRETWALLEPQFQAEAQDLVDRFMAARARKLGSDELQPVVAAAAVGRVDTLLIDADRHIPGRIEDAGDGGTFQFRPADAADPRADDVLDDLAEMVLKTEGAVLVLPPDMMPSGSGVAAIYRY